MFEELQVLTDDKRVKEPFVYGVEPRHRTILPRIVNEKLQRGRAPWCRWLRQHSEIQVEFHRIGNAGREGHAASPAGSGNVRADVGIHRTHVDKIVRGIGKKGRGGCGCGIRHRLDSRDPVRPGQRA